jgi:hypothetical protein
MRLFVESVLPVPPARAWALFESAEFRSRLDARANLRTEVLSTREETTPDGRTIEVRRMKFTSGNELPGVVAKLLGTRHLTYEQENRLDAASSRLDWVVKLPVMSDRVRVAGSTVIHPHPEGCRRVLDGVCEVKVALVGGQIEKAVVSEFERSMGRAVELVRELIREGIG